MNKGPARPITRSAARSTRRKPRLTTDATNFIYRRATRRVAKKSAVALTSTGFSADVEVIVLQQQGPLQDHSLSMEVSGYQEIQVGLSQFNTE